jgi:hypothetical protein
MQGPVSSGATAIRTSHIGASAMLLPTNGVAKHEVNYFQWHNIHIKFWKKSTGETLPFFTVMELVTFGLLYLWQSIKYL